MEAIIINWALQIAGAIGAVVAGYIAKRIGDKLGIEAQQATEALLDKAAERAVQYTEEYAAKAQKELNQKLDSHEKLATAIEFMSENVIPKIKKKYGNDWNMTAKKQIEAALGRIEKAGATKLDAFISRF